MRTLEKFEASVPIATADIKHSPTPSHIHVNPHTRDLRIWLSVSKYNLSGYQQGVAKSKELRLWFGTSAHGVQMSRCSHFRPLTGPLLSFSVADITSCLVQSPVLCALDHSLVTNRWLFPCSTYGSSSLRNPLEGLSCLPWQGAFPHPNLLRSYYESFQVCFLWTFDFERL